MSFSMCAGMISGASPCILWLFSSLPYTAYPPYTHTHTHTYTYIVVSYIVHTYTHTLPWLPPLLHLRLLYGCIFASTYIMWFLLVPGCAWSRVTDQCVPTVTVTVLLQWPTTTPRSTGANIHSVSLISFTRCIYVPDLDKISLKAVLVAVTC